MNEARTGWWDRYVASINQCVDCVKYPDNPRISVDAHRYVMACFAQAYPIVMHRDPAHPDLHSLLSNVYPFAATNPDTTYLFTSLGEGGLYRLSGKRKSVHYVDLQFGRDLPGFTDNPGPGLETFDLDSLTIGDDDTFEVVFGQYRPHEWAGDFREIDPTANYLMIRQVSQDWYEEEDAQFAIQRLDTAATKPRDTDQRKQQKLEHLRDYVRRSLSMYTGMVRHMHENGVVNDLQPGPYANIGGVSGQAYFEGLYSLREDEALILTAPKPEETRYWGIQLADEMFFSIDFMHRQSSLNQLNAHQDSDGQLRAVVSARDPGIQNWLDISGYPRGIVMWRWTQCSEYPQPTVEKVTLEQLREHLPADTPRYTAEARKQQLRRRLEGAQRRRRW